jgi:hypothetical protein
MYKIKIFLITVLVGFSINSFAQVDSMNTSLRNYTWLATQILPSPTIYNDANQSESLIIFGLKWNIIPLNISFNANKYVSPVQFFYINPVRRFTGSIELFVQPELSLASFKYGQMDRFGLGTGSRIIIPIKEQGEHLAMSIGGKYTFRKDRIGGNNGYWGVETSVYVLFNMIGLQFNYNFDKRTRYDFGMYIKFF